MSTYAKDIQTQQGSEQGQFFSAMQVLGVSRRLTETGNLGKADRIYTEQVTIDVPVGTQAIVASIEKWVLGYGEDQKESPNEMKWSQEQHRFGLGNVGVRVQQLDPPDRSSTVPKQKASIIVQMCLADESANHAWFGKLYYVLLHLGVPENGT